MATATAERTRATRDEIDKTFKQGRCQLCNKKVPVKDQYRVVSDLEKGVAKKLKGAKEGQSHYCADCTEKRMVSRQAWLNARNGSKPKAKTRAKPKAKAAAKKGKAASKARAVKRPKGKAASKPSF